jgi:succinoglycan biosynthesis protein ExoA
MDRVARKVRRDGSSAEAAHVPIARVVDAEVVPDDGPAGTQHAVDLGGDAAGHAVVEDRREHGEREHQLDGAIAVPDVLGVADLEPDAGMAVLRDGDRLGQEIDPVEGARRRAERQETGEHLAGSAAYLEHRALAEGQEAVRPEHDAQRRAALGEDRPVAGVVGRPSPLAGPGASVLGIDGGEPLDLVMRLHRPESTIPADGDRAIPVDARAAPRVTVIVPARDEERTLPACLGSILAQVYPAARLEVIVVENGSSDGTLVVADVFARRDPRVRVVRSRARNQAEAMNDGLAVARGEVVARVDAHSQIDPHYVARVVAALDRHRAAGVGGPFLPAGRTVFERAVGLARSSPFGVGGGYGADDRQAPHPVRTVQCGAYWKHELDAIGGFDPAMAFGEDEELNWRLHRAGRAVWLCPDLRQPYRPRGTVVGLVRQYWSYGRGRMRVLRKHPAFLRPRHLVPSAFVAALAVTVGMAMAGFGAAPLVTVLGAYGAVLVAAGLRALRTAPLREAALVPVAIACMHVAYGAGLPWQALRGGRAAHVVPRASASLVEAR